MRMTLQADHLRKRKPEKSLKPGTRQASIVAVAAQKGGVGKTTTAVSVASACARFHGMKVLLVDLDPQAHCNIALRDQIEVGGGALSDVLSDPAHREVAEVATHTRIDGLQVTPADPDLMSAEERLASRIGREMALRKALEVSRTHYDLIVLDCPPNVGCLTVNALVAADRVLIPCAASALAVVGVSGLLDAIDQVQDQLNPDLEIAGVVLTRVDARNSRTNGAVMDLVKESFGDLVMDVQIGVSNSLAAAQLEGCDVFEHDASSRGAAQYRELADAVLERL